MIPPLGPKNLVSLIFRPGLGISSLTACLLVLGCASGTMVDYSPEIPLDATGQPLAVTMELKDYQRNQVFVLSNASNRKVAALQRRGKLPGYHKILSDETVGRLLAFMRSRGFFEYARPTGNPPARLPDNLRRTLALYREGRPMIRMIDARGQGKVGRRDEVVAIVEIKREILRAFDTTWAFRVDPKGRSGEDFLNQPGLKRIHGVR